MSDICEYSDEEFDVPSDESDNSAKCIPWDSTRELKNVLIINKGYVKKEDLTEFGLETLSIQNDNEIEIVYCKGRVISEQSKLISNWKLKILNKERSWMICKPKHLMNKNESLWINSTKISSKKILETLFSKVYNN